VDRLTILASPGDVGGWRTDRGATQAHVPPLHHYHVRAGVVVQDVGRHCRQKSQTWLDYAAATSHERADRDSAGIQGSSGSNDGRLLQTTAADLPSGAWTNTCWMLACESIIKNSSRLSVAAFNIYRFLQILQARLPYPSCKRSALWQGNMSVRESD